MKKILKLLLCALLALSLVSCKSEKNDVIVIYTSDIHGSANENLGFASVLSFKQEALKKTPYVTLIDCGDAVQGSAYTQVSEGEAIVECMNAVGYDYLTFGNHEFDFGIEALGNIVAKQNGKYLNANIVYTGESGKGSFLNELAKYDIVKYGDISVGYIGIDTPSTIKDSTPSKLKENDEFVINFLFNDEADNFYNNIQNILDEMKSKGADVIVCLSHLGYGDEFTPYSSKDLANNTTGIDVIVDGHAHVNMPSAFEKNKDGEQVIITCSGTGIENIGYLTISSNGTVTASNTNNYAFVSDENKEIINEIVDSYATELKKELFTSNCALPIKDVSGIRMVRSREVGIGDLFADALRYYGEADIGIMNGGGIRTGINLGTVSYSDLIEIAPFENVLTVIEISGQELVDYLEYTYRNVKKEYVNNSMAYGEDGSFMQVSGIKLTIDTSITSDITVDENDNFISVNKNRRVKDVMVLEDGEYVPIDLNKTYTLAGTDYTLIGGGSGTTVVFADNNVVLKTSTLYSQVLIDYITKVLNSDLSSYAEVDSRITVQ